MNVTVRAALPTDDLTALWPVFGTMSLNREHVLVAFHGEHLRGGILLLDSGHELIYVSEVTVLGDTLRRSIAYRLVQALWDYCRAHGRRIILGHATDTQWLAMVTRRGGVIFGEQTGFVIRTQGA